MANLEYEAKLDEAIAEHINKYLTADAQRQLCLIWYDAMREYTPIDTGTLMSLGKGTRDAKGKLNYIGEQQAYEMGKNAIMQDNAGISDIPYVKQSNIQLYATIRYKADHSRAVYSRNVNYHKEVHPLAQYKWGEVAYEQKKDYIVNKFKEWSESQK